MTDQPWNRRQLLHSGIRVTAGALAAIATRRASAQFPPQEHIEDARITFITTTESSAWQKGTLLKPAFAFETLNLAIDPTPAQTIQGFGGCFNELG